MRQWAVLLAASMGMFAVQLDFFALQSAIPRMADDLRTTASDLQWVISGYMLAEAAFLIAGGRLADIFGRRRFLILGAAIFGLTSLIGGAATTPDMLIAMRIVQGIGAAIMLPVALAVTTNAFPAEKVQRALGLVFAIGSVGLAFGPLAGGILTDLMSWRVVLWLNVPVTIVLIALALYAVEDTRDETVPQSVDMAGLILVILSIAAFTFGIDRASVWGWLYPLTLTFIIGGLAGLVVFVTVETRARYPLLDLSLFRIKTFSVMTAAGSVGNGATTIIIFLSMVFLQEVEGLDPIEAGTAFVTFSLGYALASLASGRMQHTPPWIAMSCGLALGGLATLFMASTANLGLFIAFAALSGLGLGFVWAYTSVVTQSVVPKEKAGAASGTVLTVLISAGGIALAIAISIYESYTSEGAPNQGAVIRAIVGSAGIAAIAAAATVALFGRSSNPSRAGS
ncbi:MAG: MFS transporter [Methyloceanibacter sp.]|nr:MFS transporter [Methyloceanibacter sp.]